MMSSKAILGLVVALVLGALPVYFLACAPPKTATTAVPAERECPDFLGDGPRQAVVLVMWDAFKKTCMLKTVPNKLDACLQDDLSWDRAWVPECAQYNGKMELTNKASGKVDFSASSDETGTVQASIQALPAEAQAGKTWVIRYKVTVHATDGSDPIFEDPRIDIWN